MSPLHPQSISMRIPLRLACRSSPCSCLVSAALPVVVVSQQLPGAPSPLPAHSLPP